MLLLFLFRMPFFFLVWFWLELLVLCWIAIFKVASLFCSWPSGKSFQSFTLLTVGLSFFMLTKCPFIILSSLLFLKSWRVFTMKECWILSNAFSASIYIIRSFSPSYSVNGMYYIDFLMLNHNCIPGGSVSLILVNPAGVWWYLLVLIFIFWITSDTQHLFMCSLVICMFSFVEGVQSWLGCQNIKLKENFYILNTRPLAE